ncbi:hypothetical protein HPB50_001099 [Hyalomma asiaticum]|uniref:Uncharacterized protein n=1 Tax=Hyalomma asiaticum TaxID=266040 RepID=A0ACB7RX68_HYAAI|nr:hypothetical protein HPB50_001099 [Hyalomma asiaticum]
MDEFGCHGGLVFDEMKLSENINVKASGELTGFVDLGPLTEESTKTGQRSRAHRKWTQVLGIVASKGNVKAPALSKILLGATILTEKAGLFVDFWTSDGVPWNRSLWNIFGIKASSKEITCKVAYPVHSARSLHFISDFPHLVKCIRNAFVSKGLQLPGGHARVAAIKEAWKRDMDAGTLKVTPHIFQAHLEPDAFEKMQWWWRRPFPDCRLSHHMWPRLSEAELGHLTALAAIQGGLMVGRSWDGGDAVADNAEEMEEAETGASGNYVPFTVEDFQGSEDGIEEPAWKLPRTPMEWSSTPIGQLPGFPADRLNLSLDFKELRAVGAPRLHEARLGMEQSNAEASANDDNEPPLLAEQLEHVSQNIQLFVI